MSTFTNTAREVEMPNGDVVVIHNAPTGGENTTSNIKKFKYDDNGHVTESTAADAEDLNLSSYSTPTTGSTDIGASDDVQTAIGKLDHQSHIDQSNILSVKEYTRRNVLSITDRAFTAGTNNRSAVCEIPPLSGKVVVYFGSLTSTDTDSSYCAVGFSDTNGTTITTSSINRGNDVSVTLDLGDSVATSMFIYPGNSWTASAGDSLEYKNGMVIEKELYEHDPSYTGYSAPNYDLTRLEAEDRAALAEEIDAGAKNLLDVSQATFGNKSKVTFNADGSVTGNITDDARIWGWNVREFTFTLPAGTYCMHVDVTGGSNVNWGIQLRDSSNNTYGYVSYYMGTTAYFTLNATTTLGFIGKIFDRTLYIMLCTKAAFGVSKAFVPYRYDPYTTAWQNISNSTTLYARRCGRVVTVNGYMDNISFTANTAVTIGTIDSSIGIPPNQVRAVCNVGSNAYSVGKQGYVTISSTDGQIKVTSEYSGTGAVYFSLSYII